MLNIQKVPVVLYDLKLYLQSLIYFKWSDLIKPAIILAKNGFRLDPFNVKFLNSERYSKFLANDIESKKIFTKENSDFNPNQAWYPKE